jgi:hypothetical protein
MAHREFCKVETFAVEAFVVFITKLRETMNRLLKESDEGGIKGTVLIK